MRFRMWVTILLVMFFALLATFIVIVKKPLCIDSTVVEKIDRVDGEGTSTATSCATAKVSTFDEKFYRNLPELSQRISVLERFFEENGKLSKPVEIVWLDGLSEVVRIQSSKIFISSELLLHSDQLERAIVRLWLREKSKNLAIDRTLIEGALTDLLMSSLGSVLKTNDLKWPELLRSEKDYCSDKIINDRFLICQGTEHQSTSILVASARPLIASVFVSAYLKMEMKERTALLKSLPDFLQQLGQNEVLNLKTEETSAADSADLHFEVLQTLQGIIRFAEKMSADSPWQKFALNIKQQMSLKGFSLSDNSSNLDFLVLVEHDIFKSGLDSKLIELAPKNKSIAIGDGQSLQMQKTGALLRRDQIIGLKVHQLMYLSCQLPTSKQLIEFSEMADKLIYVQYCGPLSGLSWQGFFQKGYLGFAEQNSKISFMQMHLPSLRQAWLNHSENPIQMVALHAVDQTFKSSFFKNMGWQTPLWNKDKNLYNTRSVIQAVEAFRPFEN